MAYNAYVLSACIWEKTTIIIDCFEVFIERPSNLLARSQTFSNYKHHNTVKVLIGITPQGSICFTSKASGRTSDKYLTEKCGLLNYLKEAVNPKSVKID